MINHARHFSFTFTAGLIAASAVAACSGTNATLPGGPQTSAALRPTDQGVRREVPHGIEFTAGITSGSTPRGITLGPRGMWFTQPGSNQIGRISAQGAVTEFSAPANGVNNIVDGSDGNLWFTEGGADAIGRMTPKGKVTLFSTGNEAVTRRARVLTAWHTGASASTRLTVAPTISLPSKSRAAER